MLDSTHFVASYRTQNVSQEVTFGPRIKGKLMPDFWTRVDTAAEPRLRK